MAEYKDLRYNPNSGENNFDDYRIAGVVGYEGRGERTMTIYCTTKREIPGCRIASLEKDNVIIEYLDKTFEAERPVELEKSRERLLKLSNSTDYIGQCFEIMIYNRYMLFVHIPNKYAKKERA